MYTLEIVFYSHGNFSSHYESFSLRARTHCNRAGTILHFIQRHVSACKYSIRISIYSDGRLVGEEQKVVELRFNRLLRRVYANTLLLPTAKLLPLINCPSVATTDLHVHARKSHSSYPGLKPVELRWLQISML